MSWKKAALALALSGFTLLAAECAYRVKVWRQTAAWDRSLSYRLTPSVYVELDERHGERFKPNRELWISYVQDGQVVWGSTVSRSNRDGLGGRTTIAEYQRAPVKVLVFGDSFTHWNQGGATWPDLLQANLGRALGLGAGDAGSVAVLNYARGTYGVLQMLDLAADAASEHRPDLVVVALIGNDLTRGRWWCKEIQRDGVTRWMLSSRPGEFLDYRFAVDEVLVHPAATPEWCRRRLAAGKKGSDPVLENANAQFRKIRDEVENVRQGFRPWALDRSYLLRRLSRGHPFEVAPMLIPQVGFDDYARDARTVANFRRLKALGIPVLLVYLPTALEMERRKCLLDRQSLRLMQSLEQLAGQDVRRVQQEYQGKIPEKMDLLPVDNHPNRAGLRLYADAIAPMVLKELAISGKTAAAPPSRPDPRHGSAAPAPSPRRPAARPSDPGPARASAGGTSAGG